jgi:DNA polymerase III delta subunit
MSSVKKKQDLFRLIDKTTSPFLFCIYGPDEGICESIALETRDLLLSYYPKLTSKRFVEDDINTNFLNFEASVKGASLFDDALVAIVRIKNDALSANILDLLKNTKCNSAEEGAIIIYSSSLTNRSKLVQEIDKSTNALSLRLYQPNRSELSQHIKAECRKFNVTIDNVVIDSILNNTLNDSKSISALIENLSLYVGEGANVDLKSFEAMNLNNGEALFDEIINASLSGKSKSAAINFNRFIKNGGNSILALNTLIRKLQFLLNLNSELTKGQTVATIINDPKSGIFWKDKEIYSMFLEKLTRKSLELFLHQAIQTDAAAKSISTKQNEIIERLFVRIAEYTKLLRG